MSVRPYSFELFERFLKGCGQTQEAAVGEFLGGEERQVLLGRHGWL